jgi:WhiB family transcriptional regulator, redox-sensing transcriptional regulator
VNVITDTLTLVAASDSVPGSDQHLVDPPMPVPGSVPEPLVLIGGGLEEEDEEGWQERALCAQTDPEAFFPEKGGSTREAKRICSGCDVRAECLDYALAHDERFGIWGGLSERERRRLRRGEITAAV